MTTDDRLFTIKPILDGLRRECGDSEFGYRMQALYAHVLLRLGGRVVDINAQGQPDVVAELGGTTMLVQVKSVFHGGPACGLQLSQRELDGIRPASKQEAGYLALLDCAVPVSWIMLTHDHPLFRERAPVLIATLRAAKTEPLSEECTSEFADLVITHEARLTNLTFRILRARALRGRSL